MAHKRALSSGEAPSAKRSTQDIPSVTHNPPNPATALLVDPRFIYIAMRETRDPWEPGTHEVVEAYTTLQDANWGVRALQQAEKDQEIYGKWEESYDDKGCLSLSTEDEEGSGLELRVELIPMRTVGSVPRPPTPSEDEDGEGSGEEDENTGSDEADSPGEEDEDEGEPEEVDDQYAEIREAQRRGGRRTDCRGCGCGAPLCPSCWPQTEEEWEGFH